ncbi:flagellar export protein FliJ [Silanimonas sp.]|uniref:flagellar export protein FliJ n=1 Tax=Silanimonas sp. TaxID=1929290 RepID=UPI0022C32A57|nr:flagellar export protein FliJ [Silanimonas sp.]MCZ8062212.1 flagellar export protein FliJ [Silanimonas sp.]MCZ8166506.1 flagellar export protein FliJ [Silanimonas sp.]
MNSKRLDPLIRRAESREDALAKELAKRVQAHQQQAQRLGDLERFRGEYEAPPVPGTAVSASQLLNRAAFLAKIDDAVVTQQKHIATSEESLAIERTRLLLASRDKLVLEKLAASYRSVELKAEERRDQSVLDDLGARAHRERQTKDTP